MMKTSKPNTIRKAPDKMSGSKGFTLIEVALAMIVIGLIMTPFLALYNAQHKQRMINESSGRLNDIAQILDNYAQNYDRYPVPASFLTSEADAEHGMEGTTPDICPDVTTNGYCLIDRGTPATDDDILIGAVPFAELRMESDLALDSWGNKILYAVALAQTDATTFDVLGSNTISENALDPATNLPAPENLNAHDAFLVSMGQRGTGAYSAEGILSADCIAPGQPEYEDENCNFTDTFLSDVNKLAFITPFGAEDYGTRSFVDGAPEYYDDVTLAVQRPEINDWNENINAPELVTTIKNRVGIGENAVNPQHGLDVDGDVIVENDPAATPAVEGNLIANSVCSTAGDCFRPVDVYGDQPQMECDDNNVPGVEPVIAIGATSGNTQVFCGSTINESGDPSVDQFSDTDGTDRWGEFRLNGITFTNSAGGSTNCSDSGQNLGSITGTGTITCVTPF